MTERNEDPRPDQLKSWTAVELLEALHDLEQADDDTIRSYRAGPPPLNLRRSIYRRRLEEELQRRRTEHKRDH